MQDIDEECVVLEEVIDLEAAAIADPEIGEKFVVVGCGGETGMVLHPHLKTCICSS